MKSNLIFIGMPAVGKSTVGIVVAKSRHIFRVRRDEHIVEEQKERFNTPF